MSSVLRTPGVLAAFVTSLVAQLPMGALGLLFVLHTRDVTGSYASGGAVTAASVLAMSVSAPALARIADRHGQVVLLRVGGAISAGAIAGQALLSDGVPLGARIALAALAGGAQPPVGAFRRRVWNVLVDDGEMRHRLYATEGVLAELVYLLGPVAIVGGIGAASTTAALVFCAAAIVIGNLAFSRHPAVRGLAGERHEHRDVIGALRAPGVVVTFAAFVTLGVTVGAVEVGIPAALEAMGQRSLTGVVLGLWGAGSMIAGIVFARTGSPARPARRLALLLAAWGALHGALALMGSPGALALAILAAGATITPVFTVSNSLLDRFALPGTLTEAFTWTTTGLTAGIAAGAALAGHLVDAASPSAALALGATGLVGAAIVAAYGGVLERPPLATAAAN